MLRAFHNDPKIQSQYISRVQMHREMDQITQGFYFDEITQRGCAVGCTMHSNDHLAYEREIGFPVVLAYLEEHIFESLPISEARDWPLAFLSAPSLGADLSLVAPKFLHWLLIDETDGVLRLAKEVYVRRAITGVADLYARLINRERPSFAQWSLAARMAEEARAAWQAAEAQIGGAAWAALSAASACALWGEREAVSRTQADKILELLRKA